MTRQKAIKINIHFLQLLNGILALNQCLEEGIKQLNIIKLQNWGYFAPLLLAHTEGCVALLAPKAFGPLSLLPIVYYFILRHKHI